MRIPNAPSNAGPTALLLQPLIEKRNDEKTKTHPENSGSARRTDQGLTIPPLHRLDHSPGESFQIISKVLFKTLWARGLDPFLTLPLSRGEEQSFGRTNTD